MKARVTEVESFPVSIPFRIPFVIASGAYLNNAEYILVKVETAGGAVGWGESSPMPAFSKESQEDVHRTLLKKVQPAVVGGNLEHVQELLDKVSLAAPGSPYARAGVELALRDAYARMQGVPLYTTLGGKKQEKAEAVWPIGLGPNRFLEEQVKWARNHGFKEVKLKVGHEPKKDLERIGIARELMGRAAEIRIDANQGYSERDAFYVAGRLDGVHIFEQPVAREKLDVLRRLRGASKARLMVDESCYSPADALDVVKAEAADIINIKIMKAGGLGPSSDIQSISAASGVPNCLGSMLETGIATAAGVHFYVSSRNIGLRTEIVGPLFLEEDVVRGLSIGGGALSVPSGNGIGVQVVESKVKEFSQKKHD